MPEIDIDPTTRIEGHHSATLHVEDGVVTAVKSKMDMFRGIESIVLGRPPADVPQFCQMVCGVCFTSHRMGSTLAIEDAARRAGVFEGVPKQGRLLRDIMEGMFLVWNDTIHLFTLAGPDYSDEVADTGFERLDPVGGAGYREALRQQRVLLQAFAEFGGKAPHPLTYAPGGVATEPDAETIADVRETVADVDDWLGPTDAVPEALADVRAGDVESDEAQGIHDMLSILVAAADVDADTFGRGPDRFYANGMFNGLEDGDGYVLPRGVYRDGTLERPTREEIVDNIREDTAYSWYTDASAGHPAEAPAPDPDPEKEGAYSWGKAPRYDGEPIETGPLARLVAAERDPFDLRAELCGEAVASSTLHRLVARVQELLLVRDWLLEWLDALDPSGTFSNEWTDDFSAQGVGLWGASRGALSHWCTVEDGEVSQYQILSPTLWNLGPRDADGVPSTFEQAVEGMHIDDLTEPIDVMRTIRSYDPCLGCAVHVQGPEESFHAEVEPASPSPGDLE
ncbi:MULTISPECIES: nickel-dependent hydrogenase large subunit [Salinibaculum]|uniref:nickel-dependent hydrogenase large subunit n=1 Tax=Salinibaculum TaxID=2732368 RepID=UPI0030CB5882